MHHENSRHEKAIIVILKPDNRFQDKDQETFHNNNERVNSSEIHNK